jgi:choline kinase
MKAIILAAGRGTRMSEITKDKPKCLIEIGQKSILERQIEILSDNSIEKTYVVIGYKAEDIRKIIGNIHNVEIIENKDYATTDNIYSLYLARDRLKEEEFILLNGDTVFGENIIKMLTEREGKNVAPIDSQYYDLEELKIREKNGIITEILPKTAPKDISSGSTIGVFKFSSNGSKVLFDEIGKLVKEGVKNKWFEHALNNIFKNIKMYKMDVHGSKWIEIDTLEDIEKAQKLFGE